MADMKKVELERVRKGSGQSTYVLSSRNLGRSQLEDFMGAANIPYNKIYYGGGKLYVKIPSTAVKIVGVYGQSPTYYDDLGQGVSIDPALAESEGVYYDESGQGYSIDPAKVQSGYTSATSSVASKTIAERTKVYEAGTTGVADVTLGREIYSVATPIEQVGLHAHTFLSPRGWDYAASYVTSYAFPGQRGPQDIVYEMAGSTGRLTEEQRQQYVISSAVFNPPAEILYAYAGGLALGAATAAVPKLGAVASSSLGKTVALGLTAGYVAETGMSVSEKLGKNDITGAGGDLLRAGGTLTAMVKGLNTGQKYGGEVLLARTDPGLGRGAKIAGKLEGTQSEWVRSPKEVDIKQLRGTSEKQFSEIFGKIKSQDATVFGSVSKQSQHMPGLVRSAADIDVATNRPADLQRALLSSSPRGARASGTGITGPGGHIFDIKAEGRLTAFPYAKSSIRTPDNIKITQLNEEMWRSLYGSIERGGRPGWQGAKDINRFYSAARTLAESRRLQAERSTLFRGFRIRRAEVTIREVEAFRIESPKITERLRIRGGEVKTPEFGESYIPASASRLPSMTGKSGPSPRSRLSRLPRSGPPTSAPYKVPSLVTRSFVPPSPGPPRSGRGLIVPDTSSLFKMSSYDIGPSPDPAPLPPLTRKPPKKGGRGPPPPALPDLVFRSGKSRKSGKGRLSLKFGYTPSLTGIYFGGTIPKAPKISTGLGIRAPVVRKKRSS